MDINQKKYSVIQYYLTEHRDKTLDDAQLRYLKETLDFMYDRVTSEAYKNGWNHALDHVKNYANKVSMKD